MWAWVSDMGLDKFVSVVLSELSLHIRVLSAMVFEHKRTEVGAWLGNYIPQVYIGVITYPCPHKNAGLAVRKRGHRYVSYFCKWDPIYPTYFVQDSRFRVVFCYQDVQAIVFWITSVSPGIPTITPIPN